MKLSESRKQAIYDAVSKVIIDARIEIAKLGKNLPGETVDLILFRAEIKAGQAAINAAEKKLR